MRNLLAGAASHKQGQVGNRSYAKFFVINSHLGSCVLVAYVQLRGKFNRARTNHGGVVYFRGMFQLPTRRCVSSQPG